MNLADLRKVSVKKHLRIRFPLSNGMECVVNEHGVAQVPALRAVPAFNLEDELGGAETFLVESIAAAEEKRPPKTTRYTRGEMADLAARSGGEIVHNDHEE